MFVVGGAGVGVVAGLGAQLGHFWGGWLYGLYSVIIGLGETAGEFDNNVVDYYCAKTHSYSGKEVVGEEYSRSPSKQ